MGWKVDAGIILVLFAISHWDLGSTQPAILSISDEANVCEATDQMLQHIPHPDDCQGTCVASGDPHFNTFDCVKFEYHGTCSYTLVKSCANDIQSFEIIGEFHRLSYHEGLSVMKSLLVTCQGASILLDSSFGVTINGVPMDAVTNQVNVGCASIHRYCNAVEVKMDNGINIYWSMPFRASIQLSDAAGTLSGKLCGLCGNYNGVKYDDFTTPDEQLVFNPVSLGDSWRTDLNCDECEDCDNVVCQNNPQNQQQAQDLCNVFIDDSIPICGNIDAQTLYENCVSILCATLPETDRFCQLININVQNCAEQSVTIHFHLNGVCFDGCHKNDIFIPYGEKWTDLDCLEEYSCDSETGVNYRDIACDGNATCTVDQTGSGGCECNEPEYVGDGFSCTKVDPCEPDPCYNDGNCNAIDLNTYQCICENGFWGLRCENPPPCDASPCENGGTCINEEGDYRCVCPFGAWTGPTCNIRCYVCWACGDPHYNTFDNFWYDFQGKCMYTLVKSNSDFPHPFEVVGSNIEAFWNTRISIVKEVYVFLDLGAEGQFSYSFRYGYWGIYVNDRSVSLPYTKRDSEGQARVQITQAGYYTFLSTSFGLVVGWNGFHCVFIIVPETFKNQVNGLCGLFNLEADDDWTRPDGQLALTANEFGNSWVYEEIEICHEDCTSENCDEGPDSPCDTYPERSLMASDLCDFLNTEISLTGKETDQSSTYDPDKSSSGNAVDGETGGNYDDGSCTITQQDDDSWWSVNLGDPTCVGKVVIYNRVDCCGQRLAGAIVRVGDDASNADRNPICGTVTLEVIAESNVIEVHCDTALLGKVISIHLPGEYLQLCEVKAFTGKCEAEISLLGRPTEQSSTHDLNVSPSSKALDGNTNGNYWEQSCSHTNSEYKPYWSVDMGDDQCVGKVVIYNRVDCCEQRLANAFVRVGSDPELISNPVCGRVTADMIDLTNELEVSCNLKGRFVSIHLPDTNSLQVCEVKVYPGKCSEGPLAVCFDTIDPTPYLSNCRYDICAGQQIDSICDDLANYAFDCRAAGVDIPGNWRDMVPACAIQCADGMEYNDRGPACPATCLDPEAPLTCEQQNVEGCHCLEGLLWTPEGCVPPEQCGCTQNGIYYPPGTEFKTEDCSETCRCEHGESGGVIMCQEYGPCGENAQCILQGGTRDCYCKPGYSGDGFTCTAWYSCSACGDPHYISFDGNPFDFQGKCKYTLVKTISGDIDFEIIASNRPWEYNDLASVTRQLYITVYNLNIEFGRGTPVRVNGENVNLPYISSGQAYIYQAYWYTVLQTACGLFVVWDGEWCVTVWLPDTFMGNVAGLCGFFNGDMTDDFQDPQLNLLNSINDFGNSWKFDVNCDEPDCTPETCPENPCEGNEGASVICEKLIEENGPFAICHEDVAPQPYFNACSYDQCSSNRTDTYCTQFERYVSACREKGVAINGWRNLFTDCAMNCGERKRYTDCASPCPATCSNVESTECTQQTCLQGCECLPGLVLSGDECVEPSQCGCLYNGRYYQPMETFVTDDCALTCRCIGNDQTECSSFVCGDNAVCDVQDGKRDCFCEDGFTRLADGKSCEDTTPCDPNPCENGGQCTETADMTSFVCSCPYGLWTGPTCNIEYHHCYSIGCSHYVTFDSDGVSYDFQGKCSYIMAQTLTGAPQQFQVVTENIELGYWPVTITRAVYVYITHKSVDYEISFRYDSLSVYVNQVAENLPFRLHNDDGSVFLSVEKISFYTVVETDFGLLLDYDGWSEVWISLSEDYKQYVSGLCGYFNGDYSDDFTTPDFNLVTDKNDFGNSWAYGECTTPCTAATCPGNMCEGNAEATLSAQMLCDPLDVVNGFSVFEECFAHVNPANLFDDCKFDMCVPHANTDRIRCEYFTLYATMCRNAGVYNIGTWRATITACEIVCGENMEYQYCGAACPETCAGTGPAICPQMCVEGCQCAQGFVLDNDRCIPKDQCGCYENGRYYKVGESVLSDDCKSECTCQPGGTMECQDMEGCLENEVCEVKFEKRGCYCPVGYFIGDGVCEPLQTCVACGDPHYTTFDGMSYDYQGKCNYILAVSAPGAPNDFLVVGDNLPWERNPRATLTRYVHITAYGVTFQFSYDTSDVLRNNEIVNLPYFYDNKIIVYSVAYWKILITDFGLRVFWDGTWCVYIQIPDHFVGKVDGLCGHLSHDWSDDFMNPEGITELSINAFGDSWAYGENCLPCTSETCPDQHPCTTDPGAEAVANGACSPLIDVAGAFKNCIAGIDASEKLHNCRYDICSDPSEPEVACIYLEQYATDCQIAGYDVSGWRDKVPICKSACGEFMRYSDCGSGCPATCANPNAPNEYCTLECVQGCQCLPGLLQSGNTCVTQEECGCTNNGKYYEIGNKFVDDTCENECTCENSDESDPTGGSINCIPKSCDENAVCEIRDGVRGCFCTGTYLGDGYVCKTPCEISPNPCQNGGHCVLDEGKPEGYACVCTNLFSGDNCEIALDLCRASGDPHYTDFDGNKFDFQGDCEYVLTQNCSSSIPDFKIIVENQKSSWNNRVSLTRSVRIETYGQTIFLGQRKDVQINGGGLVILPVSGPNYDIYLSGQWVVVKTDFKLFVYWNGVSTVKVKVPKGFGGNLCGICGNGNGDGRKTPAGLLESNINVWGHSWSINPECVMCTDCPTEEHVCEEADPIIVEDANKQCSLINATTTLYQPSNAPGIVTALKKRSLPEDAITQQEQAQAKAKRSVGSSKKEKTSDVFLEGSTTISMDEAKRSFADNGDANVNRRRKRSDFTCPVHFEPFGRKCYYFQGAHQSLSLAEYTCSTLNANAVVVEDQDEAEYLAGRLNNLAIDPSSHDGFWIKCNDEGTEGQWTCPGHSNSYWNSDSDKQGWWNWCVNQPSGGTDNNCVVLDFNAQLRAVPCQLYMSYDAAACEITMIPPPAPQTEVYANYFSYKASTSGDMPGVVMVNITVGFDAISTSMVGTETGLWKVSMYGSANSDGSGPVTDQCQRIEQILTTEYQSQEYTGSDLLFPEAQGTFDVNELGCPVQNKACRYLCFTFTKGDTPSVDFVLYPEEATACSDLCYEPEPAPETDLDLISGIVIVASIPGTIQVAPINTFMFQPIPLQYVEYPIDVILDPKDEMVYWTDSALKLIGRAYLDGSGEEIVLELDPLSDPFGLAINPLDRVLYWSDIGHDRIERANLDGSAREIIIEKVTGEEPHALAVHANMGLLFWTVCGDAPMIKRSRTNGDDITTLVSTYVQIPNGLTIDYILGRLIWADAGLNTVELSDLDGNNRELLLYTGQQSIHPFDLAIHLDSIFWSDWLFDKLIQWDSTNPSELSLAGANVNFQQAMGICIQYGGCKTTEEETVGGIFIPEGLSAVGSDPCARYFCLDGRLEISMMSCPAPPIAEEGEICTGHAMDGECCATYTCRPATCTYEGQVIQDGESVGDQCAPCFCSQGEIVCAVLDCFLPQIIPPEGVTCKTFIPDGECCEVWHCEKEICLGNSQQSSTYHLDTSTSDKALDGDANGNYFAGSCTHTHHDMHAFWGAEVCDHGDDKESSCVGKVVIYNRVDCCGDRLLGAIVRIGYNELFEENPVCGEVTLDMIDRSNEIEVSCGDMGMMGKYISIHLPGQNALQLCEVKAYVGSHCEEQGPFAPCHHVIDPEPYFHDCTFDWCATQTTPQLCENIAMYAAACQMEGVHIGDWREDAGCVMSCPDNAHYEVCAPPCRTTCTDLDAADEQCHKFCSEGCVCDDGYVFEGDRCISAEDCGCVDDSGQYFVNQCLFVTCEHGGVCEPDCAAEEHFTCTCPPGYIGRRCQISEECLDPIGVESGDLDASMFVASSVYSPSASAANAWLGGTGWCPSAGEAKSWIRVELLAYTEITSVITKGGPLSNGWVTSYKLSYEDVPNSYKEVAHIQSSTQREVFVGNSDANTAVQHWLDPVIKTTALSFHIESCKGICTLRFEILGCKHQGSLDPECFMNPDGSDYRGRVSTTKSGTTCQKWTAQLPHIQSYTPDNPTWHGTGIGDHNLCRNPDGEPQPWCYTTNPFDRWDYCDVGESKPSCPELRGETQLGWDIKQRKDVGPADTMQTFVTTFQFSSHGVVTQWHFWADRSEPYRALVLRDVFGDSTRFEIIGINDIPAGPTGEYNKYHVPDGDRIVVQRGDYLGFAWNSSPLSEVADSADGDTVMEVTGAVPNDLQVKDVLTVGGNSVKIFSVAAVQSDWQLEFKASAGNNRGILADWTQTGNFFNADEAQSISNTADNFKKNFLFNTWNNLPSHKVKLVLLDSSGFIQEEIVFDAIGASTADWFSQSRVISSSWSDLTISNTNYFSLEGHASAERHFFINEYYAGCPADVGWLCVKDAYGASCDWELPLQGESYPYILYSQSTTKRNWTNDPPGRAAALMIFVI